MLAVRQLSVWGKEKRIVDSISFDIHQGEWFALVGQSGSGKSVTAAAIGQLLPPNLYATGDVRYRDKNIVTLSETAIRQLRGKRLSYIFQDYQGSFTPFLTIGRHFEEYQRTHLNLSRAARKQQAEEALRSVGLSEQLYNRYPFQLSGGQLQRVSIAIALLLKPDILVADEPTTALDSVSSFQILQLLSRLQDETGCAILFITHDLRHVKKYADQIAVMNEGAIVESGAAKKILGNPSHPYTRTLIRSMPTLVQRDALTPEGVLP
nr:ABC transporter ATP-binding protein [Desmospora activa]